MRMIFILVLFAMVTSGCSTFLNPFKKDSNEDYNALTYGDDYKERGGDWAPQRIRINREDLNGRSAYSDDKSSRNVASSQSVYDDERQEPTDEHVRQSVAVSRGQAVAAYKRGDRATKADFWDEAPNDGSLWSNELDANYFFTKGKTRSLGDIVSIKVEDSFVKHIAEEIKKTLSPAEQEVEMAIYRASAGAKGDKDIESFRSIASDDLRGDASDVREKMQKAARWAQVDLSTAIGLTPNEEIRAEIIEKYPNGNFKVRAVKRVNYRGSSRMMSVVGIAPVADFDEKDAVASGKLYEYKVKVAR